MKPRSWVWTALVLATAATMHSATAQTPVPFELAAAEREAIQALDRPATGYFQRVDDPDERRAVVGEMRQRLRELGISAQIGRCDWVGLVAMGTARGERAFGAACRVRIGAAPERPILICMAQYSGTALHAPDLYAFDDGYIELFIRRACY